VKPFYRTNPSQHLRRLLAVLAGGAAVLAATASLSACDTSPVAASVNGQQIKQTALQAELNAWASAPGYVSAFDNQNSTSNGGSGATITGTSPGATYSTKWVAGQLDTIIASLVVHQHLASTGALPSQAMVNAARSVSEIAEATFWTQLPASFRQTLSQRLAEQAAATPVNTPAATMQQVYQQYQPYFFTQICALEDAAFNLSQAQAISSSDTLNGVPVCYDHAAFEAQPAAYQQAVRDLAVGKVSAPIKTPYGYQVVKVVSRAEQGFTPAVQQVISAVVSEESNGPAQGVTQLVNKAHVQVNPAYGTWKNGQVTPPAAPPQLAGQ
jgi:hypothetical protein